jgi:hypothetical protein
LKKATVPLPFGVKIVQLAPKVQPEAIRLLNRQSTVRGTPKTNGILIERVAFTVS